MAGSHDKDIYKRPYVRPNEKWVCGRSADGMPCSRGPSRHGQCHGGFECRPALIGERWVCTRPDQYGGPCDSPSLAEPSFGPTVKDGQGHCCRPVHCTPQRSLRAWRGLASTVFCLALVGAVLLAIGGPWRHHYFSPGPLSAQHQGASMATLERMSHGKRGQDTATGMANGIESCHICHTALDRGLGGMLLDGLRGVERPPQSEQCLECHREDIGNEALFAHALDPGVLSKHTEEALASPLDARRPLSLVLASLSPGVKQSAEGKLACAACHSEHHGALFDLTHLDNQKCQTCHTNQFQSFAAGHPAFSTWASASGYDYPYRRRTRLIYDHESHETKHFQDEASRGRAPADCLSCHQIDAGAQTTRLKPFDAMCAACHAGDIVKSRAVDVLGFPSLESDMYSDLESELGIAGLPRTADRAFPWIMMLLLSGQTAGDPAASAACLADVKDVLEFEGDLLSMFDEGKLEGIARIFQGMQAVQQGAADGDAGGLHARLRDSLARVAGREIEPAQFDAMLGIVEPGDSAEKVLDRVAKKNDIVETRGWHVKESGFRVDAAAWTSATAQVESFAALKAAAGDGDAGPFQPLMAFFSDLDAFKEAFEKNIVVEGGEWTAVESGQKADAVWKALIENVAGTKEAAEDAPEATEAPAEAAPVEDAAVDSGGALPEAGSAFAAWVGDLKNVKKWMDDVLVLSGGSWKLRRPQSLHYRPTQHADPFLKAWIDFTAALYGTNRAAAQVFDELTGRVQATGVGKCTMCHSIDVEKDLDGTTVRVNWEGRQPHREFTVFNHTPHLKLMDCAECHRAPWVPAISERLNLATAASAEEETPAEPAAEPAPAQETPETAVSAPEAPTGEPAATPEGSTDTPGTEAAPEVPAAPAMTYADSFKAEAGGLEIGVNFSNRGQPAGTHAFASNFEPVAKSDCARCHVPGKAGDSCLLCHNYHIENERRPSGLRSLEELLAASFSDVTPSAPEAAAPDTAASADTGDVASVPAETAP